MAQTNFAVAVEGIGEFIFKRRTMRDEFAIQTEISRLIEGIPTPTVFLAQMAEMTSTLKVLTVKAPEGWDLNAMDPLDVEVYEKIMSAWEALRAQEISFRQGKVVAGQAGGEGPVQDNGVLVPPAVQPTAE